VVWALAAAAMSTDEERSKAFLSIKEFFKSVFGRFALVLKGHTSPFISGH
jgi:hypothetical protein